MKTESFWFVFILFRTTTQRNIKIEKIEEKEEILSQFVEDRENSFDQKIENSFDQERDYSFDEEIQNNLASEYNLVSLLLDKIILDTLRESDAMMRRNSEKVDRSRRRHRRHSLNETLPEIVPRRRGRRNGRPRGGRGDLIPYPRVG